MEAGALSEHALLIKALMCRQRGDLPGSLTHFQRALTVNPSSTSTAKQVGRSLILLGRHTDAIELYQGILTTGLRDWHVLHNKGVCHARVGQMQEANECLSGAIDQQPHTVTFLQLCKVLLQQDQKLKAMETLRLALK